MPNLKLINRCGAKMTVTKTIIAGLGDYADKESDALRDRVGGLTSLTSVFTVVVSQVGSLHGAGSDRRCHYVWKYHRVRNCQPGADPDGKVALQDTYQQERWMPVRRRRVPFFGIVQQQP